jgi:N-hydroxyarylamine O-acetyltransferase
MFELGAYLARIGIGDQSPALAHVHRAHVVAIPFENLDPHQGIPVSLASEDLERKLVRGRRGGYCFEQNLLLKVAFEALGADVEPMLARVRVGTPPGVLRPRSHLLLRVTFEGAIWHADAGFGAGTLLEPIPFGPGWAVDQSGWWFRVVEDGAELVLQTATETTDWTDLYGFNPEPVPFVDLETSNWFTATHPRSPFVAGLIVNQQHADGTRTTLSDWNELSLTETSPTGSTVTPVARAAIPELLETRFGLPGFTLNDSGRVVRS